MCFVPVIFIPSSSTMCRQFQTLRMGSRIPTWDTQSFGYNYVRISYSNSGRGLLPNCRLLNFLVQSIQEEFSTRFLCLCLHTREWLLLTAMDIFHRLLCQKMTVKYKKVKGNKHTYCEELTPSSGNIMLVLDLLKIYNVVHSL